MADRWMDERDQDWRERDWRRSERQGRDDNYSRGSAGSYDRSFQPQERQPLGPVFGEGETGAGYAKRDRDAIRSMRQDGDRDQNRGFGGDRGDYTGERYGAGGYSGYGQERQYARDDREPRNDRSGYQSYRGGGNDYRAGGRFYGDDGHEPIYREEYGQGGREYGAVPPGYEGRSDRYDVSQRHDYQRPYQPRQSYQQSGGYQQGQRYDRPQSYAPAQDLEARYHSRWGRDEDGRDQDRDRGRNFFDRAADRVASWFRDDDDRSQGQYGGGQSYRTESHRGRGPQGYKRSDERITEEVHERLTDDPWVDASNINVSVSGGEVTLSGTVKEREAKHRAERIVEELSGVNHVQNNLRIERDNFLTGSGRGFGDSVQEAQMKQASTPTTDTTGGTTAAGATDPALAKATGNSTKN